MKRTRIMGLCLVAVCAIFALTASSALAFENVPHYGKCEVGNTSSKYSSPSCTKLAKPGAGKDEWVPIETAIPFKSAKEKATGNAVLESVGGTKITCTGQVEKTGEYGPGNEVKNIIGEFSGCEALGFKCSSEGKEAGLINTLKLHGEPGIVTKEAKEEKNIDGNDLRGELGVNLAEFSCGGAPVVVKGGVVVKAQADSTGGTTGEYTNKMANKIEVEFNAEKGKQIPEEWTPNGAGVSNSKHEKIVEHLESSLSGGPYEQSGQTLVTVQETTGAKPKLELRQCEKTIECKN
jgi:hypothetical protein